MCKELGPKGPSASPSWALPSPGSHLPSGTVQGQIPGPRARSADLSDPDLNSEPRPAARGEQRMEMQSKGPTLGPSVCSAQGQKVAELQGLLAE